MFADYTRSASVVGKHSTTNHQPKSKSKSKSKSQSQNQNHARVQGQQKVRVKQRCDAGAAKSAG
jgi:hypothetical protein